jgi:hypothetical protein
MSAFLNPQHVLSGIYFVSRECWLLDFYFLTCPSNSNMIRLRDAADGWALDVRLSKQETCASWIYFVPHDYWLLAFFNLPMKFELFKVEDAADRWIHDARLSKQYMCYLYFIFFPMIAFYLIFIFEPVPEIQT